MGEAYERHSLGTRQRFALMGRADRKLLGFAFLFFSYAHPRVGAQRTKSGWHLWIFILDLDQLASFFYLWFRYWFCHSLGRSNSGGFSERLVRWCGLTLAVL